MATAEQLQKRAARGAAQRARRLERSRARIQWFDRQVEKGLKVGMQSRLRVVGQLMRDRVVINISRPVTKVKGPRSGRTQVLPESRSKPGEPPKADTTLLMKSIFFQLPPGGLSVHIGTPLDYGLILETRMNRSFLIRTLNEVLPEIKSIMTRGRIV